MDCLYEIPSPEGWTYKTTRPSVGVWFSKLDVVQISLELLKTVVGTWFAMHKVVGGTQVKVIKGIRE